MIEGKTELLKLNQIKKNFVKDGEIFSVLDGVSLSVGEGEFFVLLGRSGCGKTTLLRTVGGFLTPDEGEVLLSGERVTKPGVSQMMVFQDFNQLFPWMTLKKNLIYAMKKARPGMTREERNQTAERFLAAAGLSEFANQYPAGLSGGMKQRGALARALCLNPKVLLMDEPFSSLDYLSRQTARQTVLRMAQETGCTVLLVTHDIEEAAELGDRIGILDVTSHRISAIYKAEEYESKDVLVNMLKQELL
ncbi:MAG: ATP-binding cassette domain-containing protein [Lachnospiraceae bacterium]|nr:ATP-binding cassette domain-containing protein [Lachnospiraceae bacterium]